MEQKELQLVIPSLVDLKKNLDKEIIGILSTEYKSRTINIFDDEERINLIFTELFKNKKKNKSILTINVPNPRCKNNTIALFYMKQATTVFNCDKFDESYDLFTKAIANAVPGSSLLGEIYYKRSEIFYNFDMLNDCLADTKCALENSLPEEYLFAAHHQMAFCHQFLSMHYLSIAKSLINHAELNVQKILNKHYDANNELNDICTKVYRWNLRQLPPLVDAVDDDLPEFTDALEFKFTKKIGKHFVAKRDIEPGEILCVQDAYTLTINRGLKYNICSFCNIQTWSNIPCEDCIHVIYCSIDCRDAAYHKYHHIECKVIPQLLSYGIKDKFLMALRLTILSMEEVNNDIKSLDFKIKNINKYQPSCVFKKFIIESLKTKNYESIYNAASKYSPHLINDETQSVASCIIIACFYGKKIGLFEFNEYIDIKKLFDNHIFLYLVRFIEINTRIANFNGLSISMPCPFGKSIKVFTGISAYSNYFPHSCRKMIAHSFHSNKICIRSICNIKKGEIVYDNYGISFDKYDKITRQKLLKKLNYICKCKICVDDVKIISGDDVIDKESLPKKNLKSLFMTNSVFIEEKLDQEFVAFAEYISYDNMSNTPPLIKDQINVIKKLEKYLNYNVKEVNDAIDNLVETIALNQIPYLSFKDIKSMIKKIDKNEIEKKL